MIEKLRFLFLYLFHLVTVHSKYRIHSPFVYNFFKYILDDHTQYSGYEQIEKIRKDLLSRARFIKRVDHGARSVAFPYSQRFVRVRDIARRSSVSPKKGEFLYK